MKFIKTIGISIAVTITAFLAPAAFGLTVNPNILYWDGVYGSEGTAFTLTCDSVDNNFTSFLPTGQYSGMSGGCGSPNDNAEGVANSSGLFGLFTLVEYDPTQLVGDLGTTINTFADMQADPAYVGSVQVNVNETLNVSPLVESVKDNAIGAITSEEVILGLGLILAVSFVLALFGPKLTKGPFGQ